MPFFQAEWLAVLKKESIRMPFLETQEKGSIEMLIRKTSAKERTTYTYCFCDGTKIVLRPGEDGVTEEDIKMLHALDDAEVYNNIKK